MLHTVMLHPAPKAAVLLLLHALNALHVAIALLLFEARGCLCFDVHFVVVRLLLGLRYRVHGVALLLWL